MTGPSRPPEAGRPGSRSTWARPCGVILLALALGSASLAGAATYHVDASTGVDDPGRDGLSPAAAWRSLSHAVSRILDPGPHEVRVGPGEYSAATGENFPLTLPPGLSILGAGPEATVFRDAGRASMGTLRWIARAAQAADPSPTFDGFTIIREPWGGALVGIGFELQSIDAVVAAPPRLTNLVLRGAFRGLDIWVESDAAPASLAPSIEACRFLENGMGVLSNAYTVSGLVARADPSFVNSVAMRNLSDGMVFETSASWDLNLGARNSAMSSPVITHCTIAENLGSGIFLDNSNLDVRYRAGIINPRVTNSVLTGNGDYALHEYTSSTDPISFDRNLVGGNLLALYRNEGQTDETSVGRLPGTGNVDAIARFQRGLDIDFHLRGDSPGVDMIAVNFPPADADGDARPRDGNGDMVADADAGADETAACAVDAVLVPAGVIERCAADPPSLLSAAGSLSAPGLPCSQPLEITWYADGVEVGSGAELAVAPDVTTRHVAIVRCPDDPHCSDAASVDVIVNEPPLVDARGRMVPTPTGDYEGCVRWNASDVLIDLLGTAQPANPSDPAPTVRWSATEGIIFGASSLTARISLPNTGEHQSVPVTLVATDSHGCTSSSDALVRVWRGPRAQPGGPYLACQDLAGPQTSIPLNGSAGLPAGSTVTAWSWRTDLGFFEDSGSAVSSLQSPSLKLTNFSFDRVAIVTLMVTDDKGCNDESSTTVTLRWSPTALADGPYQEPEAVMSPTRLDLLGRIAGPAGSLGSWTTTLGTFVSTGLPAAPGESQVLEIPNTGADQLGLACFTATLANGSCAHASCTAVSVRVTAPQPPLDIGGSLRIRKSGNLARWSWANPPIDVDHDRAETFDAWESSTPGRGAWTPRLDVQDVPRGASGTEAIDATLLRIDGPDLLFLQVVSENAGGWSCSDPATLLPDCQ